MTALANDDAVSSYTYTEIRDSVILPGVTIGPECRLNKVVIDKGCNLSPGTTIGYDAKADKEKYYISPGGVTVVTPEMLGQEYRHVR